MTEINLFPKFLDDALSPVATSVGNTLTSVWDIVFGGIDTYSQKLEHKRLINLNNFKQELDKKVSSIPEEKLVEPPLHIIGPTLEASKFYFENEDLRSMFANLIAASINIDSSVTVHPSFVEIIKQLNPDEAKILKLFKEDYCSFPIIKIEAVALNSKKFYEVEKNFSLLPYLANCEFPLLGKGYLENLARLGLVELTYEVNLSNKDIYEQLINHPAIQESKAKVASVGREPRIKKGTLNNTELGYYFYQACISTE